MFSNLFDNIGGKIKILAQVGCFLGICVSVVSGIIQMCLHENYVANGLLTIVGGPILSWIGSFITYGFGQLVENTDILVEQLYENDPPNHANTQHTFAPIEKVESPVQHKCSVCGSMISDSVCPYCGHRSPL